MSPQLDCFLRGLTGRRPPDTYMGSLWKPYNLGQAVLFWTLLILVLQGFATTIIGLWEWVT